MIQLPKDAEGREIPLDTSELFISDGTMVHVLRFEYVYHTHDSRDAWFVHIERTPGEHMTLHACDVRLIQPDSWEKLEEDFGRGADALNYEACAYFGKSACDCSSCIADKGETCERVVMRDIADRIRKLRGESDA